MGEGKATVPAKIGGVLRRTCPWTHRCMRNLALGEVQKEEIGELHSQDTAPACECKNHNMEQPRPGQEVIPTGIHLVWVQGKPF